MEFLRTPDERFSNLPGFAFAPHYVQVDDTEGGSLRMHYLDEGPADAPVVLMLHGEPSWSFLYRKMIPIVTAAGYRVIAPDLIGFGKSDKPVREADYTHVRHVQWVLDLLRKLGLKDMTLVCQDWGGLIGLRLAAEEPELFARIVAANTILPGFPMGDPRVKAVFGPVAKLRTTLGFGSWFTFSQVVPRWSAGLVIAMGTARRMPREVRRAYDAPYPDHRYMAGARVFPRLVPSDMTNNKAAWRQLVRWEKPFLCAFSDKDPVMSAMAGILPAIVPGCAGQPHTTIRNGGHFLQEDLARVVLDFIRRNS